MRIRRMVNAIIVALVAIAGAILVPASAAHALGPGQVCVFLQPGGQYGHVGWGWLVGGTTTWVFGSTENPTGKWTTNDNGFWRAEGSFAQMKAAFEEQPHYPVISGGPSRPHNAYTRYKCHLTPTSSVNAANTAVSQVRSGGYSIVTNNCADHTYKILSAYGTPDLPSPSAIGNWYPRDWYNNLTTGWQEYLLGTWWGAQGTNYRMDLRGMAWDSGTAVQLWPPNTTGAQFWVRVPQWPGGGWTSVHNRHTGKCLDVRGPSRANGSLVHAWACYGGSSQVWRWEATGAYNGGYPVYRLRNHYSWTCLTRGVTQGSQLFIHTCDWPERQGWF